MSQIQRPFGVLVGSAVPEKGGTSIVFARLKVGALAAIGWARLDEIQVARGNEERRCGRVVVGKDGAAGAIDKGHIAEKGQQNEWCVQNTT